MPQFLIQFNYTSHAARGAIDHPDVDRAGQASKMVASLGGRLLGYWYAFGRYDGIVLMEAADDNVPAAVTMAIKSTGEVSRIETTVLITMDEARKAMQKAATANHLPPKN